MREKNQDQRRYVEKKSVDSDLAVIYSQISGADFEEAYEKGREMTMDEAVELALN